MKKYIQQIIENFIRDYEKSTVTKWGSPLVGFASAESVAENVPYIIENHGMPEDVIADARIVIAYFIPFRKEMADTNKMEGRASEEWALAYEETNEMLGKINEHLISVLNEQGWKAAVHPESRLFDRDRLISRWSHRHIAYLAGLGTFGINNMLITEKGCCGRYSTIVTNMEVEPDGPSGHENCGFKKDGSCGMCIRVCPSGALTSEAFDRHKCYEICKRNAEIFTSFGSSYTAENAENAGSEVCGKCIAGMPCAFR